MNILILTHPLGTNYGGMLQCYALSTILERMGHNVEVMDRRTYLPVYKRVLRSFLSMVGHPRYNNPKFKKMMPFVSNHLKLTPALYTSKACTSYCKKNDINAVVVGSDQVWRRDFALKYDFDYFLSFAPSNLKKISYAASLGFSEWQYNETETDIIKENLRSFSGISLREEDVLKLFHENTGFQPENVLDPTLVLNAKDYDELCSPRLVEGKYIFVYWLWNKTKIYETLEAVPNLEHYKVIDLSMLEGNDFCSVYDWLSYIKYADYVITDSFHGCAFSIIYERSFNYVHKPEVFDGRRTSLFNFLKIDPDKMILGNLKREYTQINETKKLLQDAAIRYLQYSLK